jgi:hypothetical protein
LPCPIARARRRAVKQVATMCECSINVHESPAPDCPIDGGPFASAMPCIEAVRHAAAVMLLYGLAAPEPESYSVGKGRPPKKLVKIRWLPEAPSRVQRQVTRRSRGTTFAAIHCSEGTTRRASR